MNNIHIDTGITPWNKGKFIGRKPPLRLHEIWSIRIRLDVANRISDQLCIPFDTDAVVSKHDFNVRFGSQPDTFILPLLRKTLLFKV